MNKVRLYSLYVFTGIACLLSSVSAAAVTDCNGDASVSESFANGAKWEMCWESRIRENLVLSDVYYTPPNGSPKQILSSARLAQLQVAYDDSDVTYNDVTQFGLGGGYLIELDETDCPFGDILNVQSRPVICKWRSNGNDNYRTPTRSVSAESLTLFSVSQVGAYAYIITWKFYSDGAIAPEVGATGALQRSSSEVELPFGRVLEGDDATLWLSHTHNYYWRFDFDLGDSATDDAVTETRTQLTASGERQSTVERFTIEQARVIGADYPVSWEVWEKLDNDKPGANDTGYRIEPIRYGHRLVRKETEPYTEFDFFVTVENECERFASQNARFNPDCLNHVAQYANGESLDGADITLWHRVSFHHVPRNEDQRHMHSHWDGFTMEPINMHKNTPGIDIASNSPPVLAAINNQHGSVGDAVELQLDANDADGDALSFSAKGLPEGLTISDNGLIEGNLNNAGNFGVNVVASDDIADSELSFAWTVADGNGSGESRGGFFGAIDPVFLLAGAGLWINRFRRKITPA